MEASCPSCGDNGPGKYHLSLDTQKNVYRCNLCNASGNSVSLFARMEGVSNRQAFQALSEEGRLFRFPEQPLSKKPPEREPSSLSARHDTYSDMLSHPELSPKHRADLLARGLSEERIEQNMYRSLPAGDQPRRFLAGMMAGFHDLAGIPGFCVDDGGYWNISGHSGLLVPYRDKDGSIQGMQIRLDDENNPERKYRCWPVTPSFRRWSVSTAWSSTASTASGPASSWGIRPSKSIRTCRGPCPRRHNRISGGFYYGTKDIKDSGLCRCAERWEWRAGQGALLLPLQYPDRQGKIRGAVRIHWFPLSAHPAHRSGGRFPLGHWGYL